MDKEILEAQAKLEARRKELNVTTTQPTSSVEKETAVNEICDECGAIKESVFTGIEGMESFSICKPCSDSRQKQRDAELNARMEREKEEQRNKKIARMLSDCAIGERFKGMTFDDYKPVDKSAAGTLESCKDYISNFTGNRSTNLLMIGSPGTGKNMLAAIICQELIKLDFACLHTTAMKLVRKVKDSWRDKEVSEQSVIDSMTDPALLVIDEIGVQFGSATEQLYLTEIINERYEKQRPTILISNLKLSELTAIMGERVIDRFYDDGSKILVFNWQSYRRKV